LPQVSIEFAGNPQRLTAGEIVGANRRGALARTIAGKQRDGRSQPPTRPRLSDPGDGKPKRIQGPPIFLTLMVNDLHTILA
jgi:hypothetical protein